MVENKTTLDSDDQEDKKPKATTKKKEKEEKGKYDDEKSRKALLDFVKKATGLSDSDVSFADEYEAITDVIPTGNAELDRLMTPIHYEKTGKAGIPRGFCAEFYGPNSGGKSSLAMMAAATVTKARQPVFWVDAEGSFLTEWAVIQGVDEKLLVRSATGKTGEEYLEQVQAIAASGKFPLIIVDSVTMLRPKKLLEQSLDENQIVGAGAQMMSRAMPLLVAAAKKGNTAIILINQVRNKVGIMYGNPETTPYGEAVGFYSSLRLRIQQVSSKKERGIMRGEDEIGIRSAVHIRKSRFGPPHKDTLLSIYYRNDVKPYPIDVLLDLASSNKLIKCRTKKIDSEPVQHFTLEGSETLKSIPGFDDFKQMLLDDKNAIQGIATSLKGQGVALDSDVEAYLADLNKSDDPLDN